LRCSITIFDAYTQYHSYHNYNTLIIGDDTKIEKYAIPVYMKMNLTFAFNIPFFCLYFNLSWSWQWIYWIHSFM